MVVGVSGRITDAGSRDGGAEPPTDVLAGTPVDKLGLVGVWIVSSERSHSGDNGNPACDQ